MLELSKNKSQNKSRSKESGKKRITEKKKNLHRNRLLEQPKKPIFPALQKLLHKPKKQLQSCTPAFVYIVPAAKTAQFQARCLLLLDPFNILDMKQSLHINPHSNSSGHSTHLRTGPAFYRNAKRIRKRR